MEGHQLPFLVWSETHSDQEIMCKRITLVNYTRDSPDLVVELL